MCGIAGFTRFNHSTGDLKSLKAMGDVISHRGPDAAGEYLNEYVGLCHRRLSIIDLSKAGNQPMHYDEEKLTIVFNGEIYNFIELRQELISKGYRFTSNTDTEVLLALYDCYGESMLEHINGMFAFALWDNEKNQLFIARDRLGKKPLYYYQHNGYFIFASELKSILTLDQIEREICPQAVSDFFTYQYIPDPKSIFKNVFKLEPGHCLTINANSTTKNKYWDLSFASVKNQSEQQLSEELLDKIRQSTASRMVSDVPLGAFLSGGVDSSGIVGLMSEQSKQPITTCAIGFNSQKYDEVEYARQVARQFDTEHHEFTVQENLPDQIEKIVEFFDEPFADPSLVPTFFVSSLAKKRVTVALAGDGGDECFAGYSKYAIDAIENKIRCCFPKFIRQHIFGKLAGMLKLKKSTLLRKAHSLFNTLRRDPDYGFFLSNAFFNENIWRQAITESFNTQLGDYHSSSVTTQHYQNADGTDHLAKILYTDFKTYLPGDILVKVDRMSMANSLEVRAPLLDYKVVEFAAGIPSKLKLKKGDKKHILKLAFSQLLSNDILYRKKMGFSVPLASWLRNEIKDKAEIIIFESGSGLSNYFKMDVVRKIWLEHQSGQYDYSAEIWSMLVFQLWFNRYAS